MGIGKMPQEEASPPPPAMTLPPGPEEPRHIPANNKVREQSTMRVLQ
jgi:hypothetical protein